MAIAMATSDYDNLYVEKLLPGKIKTVSVTVLFFPLHSDPVPQNFADPQLSLGGLGYAGPQIKFRDAR